MKHYVALLYGGSNRPGHPLKWVPTLEKSMPDRGFDPGALISLARDLTTRQGGPFGNRIIYYIYLFF